MLVSSITLLIAALLNFIFPDAIKLFIYVTTLSTVLFPCSVGNDYRFLHRIRKEES